MTFHDVPAERLWYRFRKTRNARYRQALVDHYTPVVQMQTAFWAYGFESYLPGRDMTSTYDGLSEPARERFFLPFVPPASQAVNAEPPPSP